MSSRRKPRQAPRRTRASDPDAQPPAAAPAAPPHIGFRDELIFGALLTVGLTFFLLLKTFALRPDVADENLYYYAATEVARGALPYRHFFFAHPPLHILPMALYALVFPATFVSFKWLIFLCGAAQIAVVSVTAYVAARRCALGPPLVAGAVALFTMLFAETFLFISSTDTGAVQAGLLLAIAFLLFVRERPLASGVLMGCAVMTLVQTAPVALVLVAASVRAGTWRRQLTGFAAAIGAAGFGGLLVGGWAFVEQTLLLHLAKAVARGEAANVVQQVIGRDWPLLVLGAAATAFLVRTGPVGRRIAGLCAASILVDFVAVATRPRAYPYYLFPVFVFLAPLLGTAAAALWSHLFDPIVVRRRKYIAVVASVAVLLVAFPARHLLFPSLLPRFTRWHSAEAFTWAGTPAGAFIGSAFRTAFWADGRRAPGSFNNPITEHLWQQSRWLDTVPDMVALVADLKRAHPTLSLFGSTGVVPLLALATDTHVTARALDTNAQWAGTGSDLGLDHYMALLDRFPTAAVVLSTRAEFLTSPRFRAFLTGRYARVRSFQSRSGHGHILLMRKRE